MWHFQSLRKIFSNKIYAYNIFNLFGFCFMFLTMMVPTTYEWIRFIILTLWFGTALFYSKGKIKLHKKLWIPLLSYIVYSILSSVIGLINDAPGAVATLRPNVIWPIMFTIIMTQINSINKIKLFSKWLLINEAFICIIDIWYCFNNIGLIPWYPGIFNKIDMGYVLNASGILIRFSTFHVCTHIFMLPYTFAIALEFYINKKKNPLIYSLLIIEVIAAYLSGRIALYVSVFISVFILYFMRLGIGKGGAKTIARYSGLFIIFLVVALVLYTKYPDIFFNVSNAIKNKIINSFTNETDVRVLQSKALIKGWWQHPILGNGAGSYSPEINRGHGDITWGYEMSYFAMLFQNGVIGFILFWFLIVTICKMIILAVKNGKLDYIDGIPFVIGLIAVLIANFVDPYLGKMGTMWMIMLPLGIASYAFGREK